MGADCDIQRSCQHQQSRTISLFLICESVVLVLGSCSRYVLKIGGVVCPRHTRQQALGTETFLPRIQPRLIVANSDTGATSAVPTICLNYKSFMPLVKASAVKFTSVLATSPTAFSTPPQSYVSTSSFRQQSSASTPSAHSNES